MEIHGGKIWIESRPGAGTTSHFSIQKNKTMKTKLNCVLLIDDDEPTNFLNQMLVEEADCARHIQVAQSGEIAIDYLTNSDEPANNNKSFPCPDLIFLDINMPAMNGWEFLEKYRELEKKQKGKIILVMLTTSLFPEDMARAEANPEISGFENKPLTPEAFNRIIQKYFQEDCLETNESVKLALASHDVI